MEHLDSVMLGVLDICGLVWYARQRVRRWLLRVVWIAGAMLGFVLVGPLALVVWVAASGLFGPKDQETRPDRERSYDGDDIAYIAACRNIENYQLNPNLYVGFHGDPYSQGTDGQTNK
ncbi:MAG: hypothetical protein ACREXM_17910 [Gammaproteobacteria bacterium]